MVKQYDDNIKEKAFQLFAQGQAMSKISLILKEQGLGKPSYFTLWKWHKDLKWKERKKEVDHKTIQKSNETLSDIKARQLQLCRAQMGKFARDLKEDKINVSSSDMDRIMKHELLLLGENTSITEVNVKQDSITIKDLEKELSKMSNNERVKKNVKKTNSVMQETIQE